MAHAGPKRSEIEGKFNALRDNRGRSVRCVSGVSKLLHRRIRNDSNLVQAPEPRRKARTKKGAWRPLFLTSRC